MCCVVLCTMLCCCAAQCHYYTTILYSTLCYLSRPLCSLCGRGYCTNINRPAGTGAVESRARVQCHACHTFYHPIITSPLPSSALHCTALLPNTVCYTSKERSTQHSTAVQISPNKRLPLPLPLPLPHHLLPTIPFSPPLHPTSIPPHSALFYPTTRPL